MVNARSKVKDFTPGTSAHVQKNQEQQRGGGEFGKTNSFHLLKQCTVQQPIVPLHQSRVLPLSLEMGFVGKGLVTNYGEGGATKTPMKRGAEKV